MMRDIRILWITIRRRGDKSVCTGMGAKTAGGGRN